MTALISRTFKANGLDIHAMNAHRKSLSQIKGGKLLARFPGTSVTVLAVSDVEGDALSTIGSGIGDAPENPLFVFDPHIVASNHVAREAAIRAAKSAILTILNNAEVLYDDVNHEFLDLLRSCVF